MQYTEFLQQKAEAAKGRIYIYALIDPLSFDIRYIGKSVRPLERLANHCNEHGRAWRHHWIAKLKREGHRPALGILQRLDADEDWKTAERGWIAYGHQAGWPLTNSTSGGDGVCDLPAESRARMAATWRGRKHRPETLLKLSASSRGRKHSEASKAHMRQLMTGRVVTWGDKLRKAICKLTDAQAADIKRRLGTVPQTELAKEYGVNKGTISNIKRGVSYSWVNA